MDSRHFDYLRHAAERFAAEVDSPGPLRRPLTHDEIRELACVLIEINRRKHQLPLVDWTECDVPIREREFQRQVANLLALLEGLRDEGIQPFASIPVHIQPVRVAPIDKGEELIVCDATRDRAAEVRVWVPDEDVVLYLSRSAVHRLQFQVLQPVEWLNLASIVGGTRWLLADHLYDDDGRARNPLAPMVLRPDKCLPRPEALRGDADRILDVLVALADRDCDDLDRDNAYREEFNSIPVEQAIAILERRISSARSTAAISALQVLWGRCVQNVSADTLRALWTAATPRQAASLVRAGLKILSLDETKQLFLRHVRRTEPSDRAAWGAAVKIVAASSDLGAQVLFAEEFLDLCPATASTTGLCYFWECIRSPMICDWIESRGSELAERPGDEDEPPEQRLADFGLLLAISGPPWSRVEAWLGRGWPLDAIAVRAALAVVNRNFRRFRNPLGERVVGFPGAPEPSELRRIVSDYVARRGDPYAEELRSALA